mgnify:CR=1 FL=1
MIEISIKQYLDGHLSVPAFFEKPKNLPERYVLVEKTGGAEKNHISAATFAFQSYAGSMSEAAQLNDEVKRVIADLVQLDVISAVALNGDYNFTDTATKKYRYQAVFDISHY